MGFVEERCAITFLCNQIYDFAWWTIKWVEKSPRLTWWKDPSHRVHYIIEIWEWNLLT